MQKIHLSIVFTVLAALAPVSTAADEDPLRSAQAPPWRIIVAGQLKAEEACDLNEVLAYQEFPLGDDIGVDGRVSCFDGREFNFTRKGKHRKFSFKLCTPAVC